MRVWFITAVIAAGVLIFTHASSMGILIAVACLGLAVLLLLRPVGRSSALLH